MKYDNMKYDNNGNLVPRNCDVETNWMNISLEECQQMEKEFRERMAIKEQTLKIGDKVMADDHIKAKFHGEVGTIVEPQDGDRTKFDDGRKLFWVKFDKPNMGTWALSACEISKI